VIQKKVALLGAAGVGKTSLVRRFVESLFDEKYLSTIGVKVDKKQVRVGATGMVLMLWDIGGAEDHFDIPSSYIRGAAGFLLVVDGTRRETLERGRDIVDQVRREVATVPYVIALNKIDLQSDWQLESADLLEIQQSGAPAIRTSAKTGEGVEQAFLMLAEAVSAGS
jgi:small GTP-binding protein